MLIPVKAMPGTPMVEPWTRLGGQASGEVGIEASNGAQPLISFIGVAEGPLSSRPAPESYRRGYDRTAALREPATAARS